MDAPLSVVVPTCGRRGQILAAVEPLLADPMVGEVIVVVDGSQDGTLELLEERRATAPALRVLWQDSAGEGPARQHGALLARCPVLLFLDDDVVPRPGLAAGHLAAHESHPGHVIVGAMPTPPPVERDEDSVTTDLYREAYDHCTREYERDPDTILDNLWMGNVSMRREQALAVGLADPELKGLYFQDRGLGLRLRSQGARAAYRPELTADHRHRRSLRAFRDDALRQGRALTVLSRRHPDAVPCPTPRWIAGRAPLPARWLVLAAAQDERIGAVITSVLLVAARVLGWLRVWRAQRLVVVLLQRAGQAAGVAATHRSTSGRRWTPGVPPGVADLLLPAPDAVARSSRAWRVWRVGRVGGRSRAYVAHRGWAGATVMVPSGVHRAAASLRATAGLGWRRRLRRGLAAAVARVAGTAVVVTAAEHRPPAAVAAALGPATPPPALVVGGGGPRRRAAYVVDGTVVKVCNGGDAQARATHEQEVMARLHALGLGGPVPRPLGTGGMKSQVWSAESAGAGVPLAELLADGSRAGRARTRRKLEPVAAWLAEVALATRTRPPRPIEEPLVAALAPGIGTILCHGDLAAGFNLLVAPRSFTVIDWETSVWDGLPLADLLPLLAGALAAGRGGPVEQAAYVLRLCGGADGDGAWLLSVLRGYCARAGVPLAAAGALATLAWRREAAMQGAHRALVSRAGGHVPAWESVWEVVAERWLYEPGLGTSWPALGEG